MESTEYIGILVCVSRLLLPYAGRGGMARVYPRGLRYVMGEVELEGIAS